MDATPLGVPPFETISAYEDDAASQWALRAFFPDATGFAVSSSSGVAEVSIEGSTDQVLLVQPVAEGVANATVTISAMDGLRQTWSFKVSVQDGCLRPVEWTSSVFPAELGERWLFRFNEQAEDRSAPSPTEHQELEGEASWTFTGFTCSRGIRQAIIHEEGTGTVRYTATPGLGLIAPAPRDSAWQRLIRADLTRTTLDIDHYLDPISPIVWRLFGTEDEELTFGVLLSAGFGGQHTLDARLAGGRGLTLLADRNGWRDGYRNLVLERID